ncbi:outer membrane lipoprotein-sorting protein [Fonticella tunisiensis]|uniref:Outer membrane lipoprotein-sorting protein n=2 Tax=Fonticella tunisiensis TaxID=1096341 RepID=A0A4R7KCD1_9CLOT|nr:outer membrane lipoprotein-sorting protein [Fonticella tunisiensis]
MESKINKHKFKDIIIAVLIFILLSLVLYMYWVYKNDSIRKTIKPGEYSFKNITSIQYQEVKESYGPGDGKQILNNIISYVYPDKLRIESNVNNKIVEIYNNDKYIYYNSVNNKIKVKECFPPDRPYITEIEERMSKIFDSGGYEFFGYEEIENRRCKVIGVKWKVDGKSYMHKLWIADINKTTLPVKEEYFINNSVVSKTLFTYMKINEPINPEIFDESSLPNVEVVNDGVLPKYVKSIQEAQKHINFRLFVPSDTPEGFLISEVAVIPPVGNPSFYCIYFKDGYRIYLGERKGAEDIRKNGRLGNIPCEFSLDDEKVSILWNQENVHIVLTGDEAVSDEIIKIAEQIAKGKLIVD